MEILAQSPRTVPQPMEIGFAGMQGSQWRVLSHRGDQCGSQHSKTYAPQSASVTSKQLIQWSMVLGPRGKGLASDLQGCNETTRNKECRITSEQTS